MKLKLILPLFSFLFLIASAPALAVTASDSATITPSVTESENLENRIKRIVQDNLASTEGELKEKIDGQILVGYTGTISEMSSTSLSLNAKNAQDALIQITTNEKTAVVSSGKEVKFSSLALSDQIIAIGTSLKDDLLLAKRIIVVKAEKDEYQTKAIVATVTAIDAKKKTITLKTKDSEESYTIAKKSKNKITDFTQDQQIFAIIITSDTARAISTFKPL